MSELGQYRRWPRSCGDLDRECGYQADRLDQPAREAAIAAFEARHPEIDRLPESAAVAHIVAWAAQEHSAWFWRGVRLPARR